MARRAGSAIASAATTITSMERAARTAANWTCFRSQPAGRSGESAVATEENASAAVMFRLLPELQIRARIV